MSPHDRVHLTPVPPVVHYHTHTGPEHHHYGRGENTGIVPPYLRERIEHSHVGIVEGDHIGHHPGEQHIHHHIEVAPGEHWRHEHWHPGINWSNIGEVEESVPWYDGGVWHHRHRIWVDENGTWWDEFGRWRDAEGFWHEPEPPEPSPPVEGVEPIVVVEQPHFFDRLLNHVIARTADAIIDKAVE